MAAQHARQEEGKGDFKLMSWNANGMTATLNNLKQSDHQSLSGFFQDHDLDAVCFQETKVSRKSITAEMRCVPGYESFWAIPQSGSHSGVTTWVRAPHRVLEAFTDDLGSKTGMGEDLDREGRCVITDLGHFVLCNVYVPAAKGRPDRLDFKCRFLESLKKRMCEFKRQGREVVLVGDLNVAEPRDLHHVYKYDDYWSQRELQLLRALTSELVDAWRHLHPVTEVIHNRYTEFPHRMVTRPLNEGMRIDYVLVSPGLLDRVVSCEIIDDATPPEWSDHVPVVLKLRGITGSSGPCPTSGLSSRNTIRDANNDDSDVDDDGDDHDSDNSNADDSDKDGDGDTSGATTNDDDEDDDAPPSQDARKRPRVE